MKIPGMSYVQRGKKVEIDNCKAESLCLHCVYNHNGKSQSSSTWRSIKGGCNLYALMAVNAPIMRIVSASSWHVLQTTWKPLYFFFGRTFLRSE